MKLTEAFAKRTYGSITSHVPRRQMEQAAKQIVDAAEKFAAEEVEGADVDKFVAFESLNLAHYEYRILLGFVEKELRQRGHAERELARQRGDFADMQDDMNQGDKDHNWGHGPVVQEAYDTVPIHPAWGGPPTPDNTEMHAYYTTDFYQALQIPGFDASAGGGGMGGGMGGIEGEEQTMDDKWHDTFSLDDEDGGDQSDEEFSFTDFLKGDKGGCGDEHKDVHELKGGWKLYKIDDEGNNGGE